MSILIILLVFLQMNTLVLYDFSKADKLNGWFIVNDDVMGGRSTCSFSTNENGNAVFEGQISLDNYGGFSSVHYRFNSINTKGFRHISLRIKGDGKRYQLRIKIQASDYYSYIAYFETTGDWQTVKVPLAAMYPSFRGRTLDMPNFEGGRIEEIALLIGNKTEENFRLEIDRIELTED